MLEAPRNAHRHVLRRAPLWLAVGVLSSVLTSPSAGSTPARVAPEPSAAALQGRPDRVVRINPRNGKETTYRGSITENTLEGVTLTSGEKEQKVKGDEIVQIVWGSVPPSFTDGENYLARRDYGNALARFQEAAADASARTVVQAAARRRATDALLAWGAVDPGQFANCVTECDRFLSDHAGNRDVPEVRWIKGRAQRLAGDTAGSAATFNALFNEGAAEPATQGYERSLCMRAGLEAADALVASGNGAEARPLYLSIENELAGMIASLEDPESLELGPLLSAQARAAMGEGFCMLASGQADQALTFFEGRSRDTEATAATRSTAALGLAEAYLASGKTREAQLQFARVSAAEYTDRDRMARALVGLAESTMTLLDTDAKATARRYLDDVIQRFGDTPAAARAAETLKTL